MRLNEIELVGYKPFLLNNIRNFTLTPNSIYQIILGTNGSGKSSLLKELNPLPASSSDFIKTGYKKTTWTHNGVDYILTSTFKNGNKHSFKRIRDGVEEELNEGGTGVVQKDLIKYYFGVTSEIFDLLTDKIKFTTMSPSKRREWLTSICDTDFSYALSVFNKLKSLGRDTQGAFKHVANRITKETTELERIGDLNEIVELANLIREELNILLQNKEHNTLEIEYLENRLNALLEDIRMKSITLIKTSLNIVNNRFSSKEELKREINNQESFLKSQEALSSHFSNDLNELQELEETLSKTGFGGIESIKQRLIEVNTILTSKDQNFTFKETPDAIDVYNMSEEVLPILSTLLNEMFENEDGYFNKSKLSEVKDKFIECKKEIERIGNGVSHLENKIENFTNQTKSECPECNHKWIPGFTEETKQHILSQIEKGKERIKELEIQKAKLEDYVTKAEEYDSQIQRFKYLVKNYPRLRNLWDSLLENKYTFVKPKTVIPLLGQWLTEVNVWVELQKLRKEKDDLTHAIEASTKLEGSQNLTSRMSKLKQQLEETTNNIVSVKKQLFTLNEHLSLVNKIESQYDDICNIANEIIQVRKNYLNSVRNKLIDGLTYKHQNRLAEIQRKCTEKETLVGIIKALEEQKKSLEQDQDVYKTLVTTLSPTEGLIAEQLTGFIKTFTEHINSIIEKVWTYDLKVKPCGLESGELDYKFPLQVKNEEDNVSDISNGSTGQCDIIDFSFKLIVMSYLKLTDFPLYLDELGASFDEQHRVNVMTFIKELMETGQFNQVFLISHYASSHGVFQQVETIVMDPTNIVVPNVYNSHVIMN